MQRPLSVLLVSLLCAHTSHAADVGPHAREALRHAVAADAAWAAEPVPFARPPAKVAPSPAQLSTKVYGYLPYWSAIDLHQFRWELVSDILVFSAELGEDGAVARWHGWPNAALLEAAHAHGVKVHLCATLFNSAGAPDAVARFLANGAARDAAVRSLAHAVASADGLNLDFEMVPSGSRDAFTAFAAQARAALRVAAPRAEMTLAVPARPTHAGYDGARLAAAGDRLLLMAYDLHFGRSPSTGPTAPLTRGGFWPESVDEDLDGWLSLAHSSALALGVPYYGYDWPAAGAQAGAATAGDGRALLYKDAAPLAAKDGALWDSPSQTPWFRFTADGGGLHQVWYDDARSLALKYRLARSKNLGGVMIWALGYDGGRADLWETIRSELGSPPPPQHPEPEAPPRGCGQGGTALASAVVWLLRRRRAS